MDPNANLEEARRLSRNLIKAEGEADYEELTNLLADAVRLATLFEALDGWIRRGNFLPRDWVTQLVGADGSSLGADCP